MLRNHKTEAFSDVKGISFPNLALECALSEKRLYIFCALPRAFCSRNCQAGRHGGGTHEEELCPHCEHRRNSRRERRACWFVECAPRAADRCRSCSSAGDISRTRACAASVPGARRRTRSLSLRADGRALRHRHRSSSIHPGSPAWPCLFLPGIIRATCMPSRERKLNGHLGASTEWRWTKIVRCRARPRPVVP